MRSGGLNPDQAQNDADKNFPEIHISFAIGFYQFLKFLAYAEWMYDHRAAPRYRVLKAGTIAFGSTNLDCLIRNVSSGGAGVEIRSPLWFPDCFVLVMTSDGSARQCHVVWRNQRRIGVAFDD